MKTCRTCINYEPLKYGQTPLEWGFCRKINGRSEGSRTTDGNCLSIGNPDKFGCIFHAPLNPPKGTSVEEFLEMLKESDIKPAFKTREEFEEFWKFIEISLK